jgi:hypothetical protein
MPSSQVLDRIARVTARRNPVLARRMLDEVEKSTGQVCDVGALHPDLDGVCFGKDGFAISSKNNPLPFAGTLALASMDDAAGRFAGLGLTKARRKTVVNVYEAGTERPATADAVDELRRTLAGADDPGPTTPADDAKRKRTRRTPARKSQPTVTDGLAAVAKDAQAAYERGWSDLTTKPAVAKSRATESAVTSALAALRAADPSRLTKTPTTGRTFADAVTDRLQETARP